jgi:hypothetical protein
MMNSLQKVFRLAFLLLALPVCIAEVSTTVYLRDSNELLGPVDVNTALKYVDYGEVMVGTELAIVIDSNVAEHWSGRLLIEENYRNYGTLYARGDFEGFPESCLEAAGPDAAVFTAPDYWEEENKYVQGFDLYNGFPPDANSGDWFIIDYNAIVVGDANIALYWQQDEPPFEYGLIHYVRFLQVPTRDLNIDWQVDFEDFSTLAGYWYDTNCIDVNWCEGADLDNSGLVDVNDLMLFTDYWLEKSK